MSVKSEVQRITNSINAVKQHLGRLGVDISGNIDNLAENVTVLEKPAGNR